MPENTMTTNTKRPRSTRKRKLLIITGSIIFIGLTTILLFKASPWPSALLIRYVFTKGAKQTNEALLKYVPQGIIIIKDQQYDPIDPDAFLDVYYPAKIENTATILPVVVWIHGGGWVSGTKSENTNYYQILAAKGFVVVSIDYSIAPEKNYPTPLIQTNAALTFLKQHADRYHIDPSRFFLAGDSGGAHIAAQVANIISSPAYSHLTGVGPGLNRSDLSGMLLYCGAYDVGLANFEGIFGTFLNTVLWSYSGTKDFKKEPFFKTASVIDYVNHNFPPSFISVGNNDPLQPHSLNLARKLTALNVDIDTLFFPKDHQPLLPHEYQFNLDLDAGKLALERSVEFLNQKSAIR